MNSSEIKNYLKKLNIQFTIHEHPPFYTVEEANKHSKISKDYTVKIYFSRVRLHKTRPQGITNK